MFISMHQPDYMPWLGYFNKIAASQKFIFFDTADYSGRGFHQRNKLKINRGWTYISIPVSHSEFFHPLKDAQLPEDIRWADKHWKSLMVSYGRAPYWEKYSPFFKDLYEHVSNFRTLAELNISIITNMCKEFGINTELYLASDFAYDKKLKSTEAILAIIKQLGATEFLAGPSGKKYLDKSRFQEEGIDLHFQEFHEREHVQMFPPFLPGLSAVDLLFNEGPNSIKYLI